MSWKTVYINQDTKVSIELNSMKIIVGEEYVKVNISDINTVIFAHNKMQITIPLICRLLEENINILISDAKQDPIGVFMPFNKHSLAFAKIETQIYWRNPQKKRLWKEIIQYKIKSECSALMLTTKNEKIISKLQLLSDNVLLDDKTNKEGTAAKLYFKAIFGEKFIRFNDDAINYAINYGYKIIASHISRVIASRGYLTQLGIHHRGESNAFNLTYDFIEIYRYIVDVWVYYKVEDCFEMRHRHELINILNWKINICGKSEYLANAIEKTIDSYFSFLVADTKLKIPDFSSINYNVD